jgi:hypothetical protein
MAMDPTVRKGVSALAIVLVLTALFTVCVVTAMQLLEPRHMPFGVTGQSPVVSAIQAKDPDALSLINYSSEADLIQAAQRGDIYGGYIPGTSTDTIVTVPAKSFFGEIYVRGAFSDAAKQAGRETTTTTIAALPTSDRTGAVVGLLMLPTLIGGYLIATMLFAFTHRAAVAGRIGIILGFSILMALITGAAAVVTGAVLISDIWVLLPCFALVTASVALAGVVLQQLFGKMGTLLIALLFIIIGGSAAGGVGVSLLPDYWQTIGLLFPPRHAVELYRNVLYFGGNNIILPIVVLGAYALGGAALIVAFERRGKAGQPAAAPSVTPAVTPPPSQGLIPKILIAPIAFAVLLTTIFGFNYMSSGHEPIANDMPFGVVGTSTLPQAAQGPLFSIDVIEYPSEEAATEAMNQGEIYGALTAAAPGSASQLTVVNSISDISPLDIAANFERAAAENGETITVTPYAPTPLATNDPFALVSSLVLIPLLVAGYMATTLLTNALGSATGRWRAVWLLGFAVVTALVVDLIVTFGLQGLPTDSFLVVWPIMALIILSVAFLAAVLRRILGPVGIFVTVIAVIQFGNPSSGGANGVPYLPDFWKALGPFLPPRNAYELLRDTVYFGGHGIAQALLVLLAYAGISAAILVAFDLYIDRPSVSVPGIDDDDTNSAAVLAPVGPPP